MGCCIRPERTHAGAAACRRGPQRLRVSYLIVEMTIRNILQALSSFYVVYSMYMSIAYYMCRICYLSAYISFNTKQHIRQAFII